MSEGFFVWYSLLVSLVDVVGFFGSPRNVLLAANCMEVYKPVFLKSDPAHVIRRKPIFNIFSRKLADAENVPEGQVNAPCCHAAYDFDVAFFNKKFAHGGSPVPFPEQTSPGFTGAGLRGVQKLNRNDPNSI
jgi:hypothetical protein